LVVEVVVEHKVSWVVVMVALEYLHGVQLVLQVAHLIV
jgi:hypothetical protein